MKMIKLMFFICILQTLNLYAQKEDEHSTITVVSQMPMFEYNSNNFLLWVYQNIKYPQTAIDDSVTGRVIAKFLIDTIGHVEKVEIVRSVRWDLDHEVKRVIESSPNWTPGMQIQKGVGVYYSIPVDFSIKDPEFQKQIEKLSKNKHGPYK